jgi:UDP-glucose 4-epimerase
VNAFISATGVDVPYIFAPRRDGDVPAFYANASKAEQLLNWKTERSIEDACRDTWKWQSQNPNGFAAE